MARILQFAKRRKYEILLGSLAVLIFGQLLIPEGFDVQAFLMIQNIVAGLLLFSDNNKMRALLLGILFSIVGLEIYAHFYHWKTGNFISFGIYILYFLTISVKVYIDIYRTRNVTTEMIAAVFSGFIMLALIGGLLFSIVELSAQGSFSNLSNGIQKLQDLQYFGFVTTLTIGYGDITPLTVIAKKTTILMGLLGNFYTVFVMGIVIGKFLSSGNKS
jgi:voltage-gated potassium channel